MSNKVERIGISLETELLKKFDQVIDSIGYQNRSEAFRDMIREKLSQKQLQEPKAFGVAVVCVVYDHHSSQISQKLAAVQHNKYFSTIASMHIHIDHDNCLEIITLRGKIVEIKKMAEQIVSFKGVKLGKVNLISIDCQGKEGSFDHHHH